MNTTLTNKETIRRCNNAMPIAKRVVREIPAINRQNITVISKKENVTYYARVSTENEEQEDSYKRQKEHFEQKIKACPEWNYV